MIYLDTSVALAHLLAEDRRPPADLWASELVSSRLLEHELRVRLNDRGLERSHGDAARLMLSRVALVEFDRSVLARALDPFPVPVRTLDALHLASAGFLREQGVDVQFAAYDDRMRRGAEALGFPLTPLPG
ncbi:MAG: PIN domain-containing protein [Gemmatimonadota bacterium]|nr:PIN domain-containing protein [Gemmatimonadota bacterium]